MFPIVLFVGLASLIYAANRATSPSPHSSTVISGPMPYRVHYAHRRELPYRRGFPGREALLLPPGSPQVPPQRRRPTALEVCIQLIRDGHHPAMWLVERAMKEAIALKRFDLVHAIHERLTGAKKDTNSDDYDSFRVPKTDTKTGEDEITDTDDDGESVEIDENGDVVVKESPLDGVDNEAWTDFVSVLKTQNPDYKSDRHVGAFHHSLDRLKELGLKAPTTEEDQVKALQTDIEDCRERGLKTIQKWCGDMVEIGGKQIPISESGILGVMKAAGIDSAEDWLTNPEDRKKFRMTTDTFMRSNGIF